MRDLGLVQPADLAPQATGELIGDAVGRDSSRDWPATSSMVSSTDPSLALMTWPTCGTMTPARSAITASSASCSTALNSEAAGLVSPTPRNRMPRQARYSRSASRWSEP